MMRWDLGRSKGCFRSPGRDDSLSLPPTRIRSCWSLKGARGERFELIPERLLDLNRSGKDSRCARRTKMSVACLWRSVLTEGMCLLVAFCRHCRMKPNSLVTVLCVIAHVLNHLVGWVSQTSRTWLVDLDFRTRDGSSMVSGKGSFDEV